MRARAKKVLRKIGLYLEQNICIPQNYSFFIFGSHGSGLHSLMYFVSLLNGGTVYPTSMFVLRKDIDRWRNMVSCRFFVKNFQKIYSKRISKWGLTFDGGPTDHRWISKNITKRTSSLLLVRDPILAIVSHMNYRLYADIYLRGIVHNHEYYYNMIVKNPIELYMTCGFYTNIKKVEKYIGERLYLDTSDLMGHSVLSTMQNVADFLSVKYEKREEFLMGINTPFTRYFPIEFVERGIKFRVSPFRDLFEHCWYPKYCEENKLHYVGDFVCQERLYIFSYTKYSIDLITLKNIYKKIQTFVGELEMKMAKYEDHKIKVSDLKSLLSQDNKYFDAFKNFIDYETMDIRKNSQNIAERWSTLQNFFR